MRIIGYEVLGANLEFYVFKFISCDNSPRDKTIFRNLAFLLSLVWWVVIAIAQYDSSKFFSENAQDRYFDLVSKRNPIAEKGLCLKRIDWPNIIANI